LKNKQQQNYRADNPVNGGSDRSFGLVFACVFGLIGVWSLLSAGTIRWWAIGAALGLILVALTVPGLLAIPNRLWTKFGLLLHRIVNPIILAILFFIVFVPMAIWLRVVGRQPIRRLPPDEETFWRKPEKRQVNPESFRKLY
jgi:hypothetical protein